MSDDEPAAAESRALRRDALRGVRWTGLEYAVDRVVGFATTLVLARLLAPSDFGIVALATLSVSLVNLLSSGGLANALVVRPEMSRRAQGTVFTLVLASGAVATASLAAAALPAASLFAEPRLRTVLPVMSLLVLLGSFTNFYATLLQRQLAFGRRFACVSGQAAVATIVGVALAAAGAGVWSLVVSGLAGGTTYALLLLALSPYRVAPAFALGELRGLVAVGGGFVLQGLTGYLQLNADYIVVGRAQGTAQLGYYSTAYRLGELPQQAVVDPVVKVTFPAFARMRAVGEPVTASFLTALRLTALVACPLGVILSATASPFVDVVLSEKWRPSIGPITVFGLWAAVRALEGCTGWLLNAVGQATSLGRMSAALLPPHVAALAAAAWLGDLTTVALVMLGHIVTFYALVAWTAARRAGVPLIEQWRAVRPVAIGCVAAWAVARVVAEVAGEAGALVGLAAGGVGGLAAYLLAIRLLDPSLPRTALAVARETLRRRPASARGAAA